jgi:hypothetical protein
MFGNYRHTRSSLNQGLSFTQGNRPPAYDYRPAI